MNYILFLLKKVLKNKITYIPIVLASILVIAILFLNANEAQKNNLLIYAENNLTQDTIGLDEAKNFMKQTNLSDEDKSAGKQNLETFTSNVSSDKEAIKNLKTNNWPKIYDALLEPLSITVNSINSGKALFSDTEKNYIQHDFLMFKALKQRNLSYENPNYPTKGINYSLFIMQIFSPIFLFITITFILSSLFSDPYHDKINSHLILPTRKIKLVFLNIASGVFISIILISVFFIIPFLLGLGFFGLGATNYPVLSYSLSTHLMFFQNISKIFLPSFLLQLLSAIFISSLIYLISSIIRDKLATLFVSSIIILGTLLSVNVIAPAQKFAQLIPTTYMNSVSVVTGEYAHKLNNFSISFNQGVYVLITAIVITLTFNILISEYIKKY